MFDIFTPWVVLFSDHPAVFLAVIFLLGLLLGSFLNVVIYRLPLMMQREWRTDCREYLELPSQEEDPINLVTPRSRCGHCNHQIRAWENIPLLSYAFLRGRCSACGTSISWQYPFVELLSGVLSLIVAWRFGLSLETLFALLFTWALLAASGIDVQHKLLPDSLVLPILWLGLLISLVPVFTDSSSSLIGAAVGYMSLWSLYWVFKLLTGKEGMGYGDFKLLALLGAWCGWQALFVILLTASFLGAIIGIGLILLQGRDRANPIPFGPFLAGAGWVSLLWGAELTQLYWDWLL